MRPWHSEDRLCCFVADGAGGHGGGDVAAKLVVSHIIEQASLAPLARADEVQDLLIDANAHLRRHQADSATTKDMHSTVVALFVDLNGQEALWGHAGDSRLYVFRDGVMLSHTRDHSVVQLMADAGCSCQSRSAPIRAGEGSALQRAQDLLVSIVPRPGRQAARRPPAVHRGLWEYIDEAEMCRAGARLRPAPGSRSSGSAPHPPRAEGHP